MELIAQLKRNDESALSALIDLYANNAFRISYSILKNRQEAEEIVQEVFVKIWNYRNDLKEQDLLPLIKITSKRLSLNRLRNIYFQYKYVGIDDTVIERSNNFKDEYSVKEILELEENIIAELPEQQNLIYKMSRKAGKSYEEIAEELGLSPNTVKNHIVKALKTIRIKFKRYGYLSLFIFFLFD